MRCWLTILIMNLFLVENRFALRDMPTYFPSKVQDIRDDELSWFRRAQLLAALNSFILNSIPVVVTVVSFGVYSLLGVLRFPLFMLPNLITQAERPTLSNVNVDVPVGSLVAIVGSTGEGI
nr:unnamed protein product [Digitaria exilis]